MKKRFNRIGIFDSGIGGITVLKEIMDLLPNTEIVYLGDSARLPYGMKSQKTIVRYSLQCARFLLSKDIDMLVVACNTASAHALNELKAGLSMPVVGVIDAGARAAIDAGGKRIGIVGTPSTIKSRSYDHALKALDPGIEIFSKACPLFVPLVEEGWFHDDITMQVARRYLGALLQFDIDTLVLGCTHYPLLRGIIAMVAGDTVAIVDSAQSSARVVSEMYGDVGSVQETVEPVFYLSDLSAHFIELGSIFLGREMKSVYEVDLCV